MKKNKSTLKKKVFGPVEAARNERLSAKLLELASKSKPPRPEMEVDGRLQTTNNTPSRNGISNTLSATESKASEEAKEDQTTEGASKSPLASLSVPIPACLVRTNNQLPTPPSTPTLDAASNTTPILDRPAQKDLAKEMLFFHLLGTAADVIGFDEHGELELSFTGPDPT